jgi:hypothetical protein
MLLQACKATRPERPMASQPVFHLAKRLGIEPVHPPLRIQAHKYHAGFLEASEVARNARSRHFETLGNAARRKLARVSQQFDDAKTRRISESSEYRHAAIVTNSLRNVNVA